MNTYTPETNQGYMPDSNFNYDTSDLPKYEELNFNNDESNNKIKTNDKN